MYVGLNMFISAMVFFHWKTLHDQFSRKQKNK